MKLSIITVCLNSEKNILKTIKSVINQDYNNFEYIFVDGKSTDKTIKIIQSFKDSRIKLISEKDSGIYDAINKGIRVSNGDIVYVLHSDDYFIHNNVLKETVDIFNKNSKINIITSDVKIVDSKNHNRVIRYSSAKNFKKWKLYFGFFPPHPGMFIKRDAYKDIGLYEIIYKLAGDFDWVSRAFAKNKFNNLYVSKVFVHQQAGGLSNMKLSTSFKSTKEINMILKKNFNFSFILFLYIRLPIKFFNQIYYKIRYILFNDQNF